jgi:hypothetical protein
MAESQELDGVAVDALPVLAEEPQRLPVGAAKRELSRERVGGGSGLPVVQAAAVAAGGFVAGAAVAGLVQRRGARRRLGRAGRRGGQRKGGRAGELIQIVGSRSLLVDVHLLGVPATDR